MATALIEINGVAGSNDDLPINTLVQLSNGDTGGEVTYLWEILDQPEGTADSLSGSAIENPTFTPTKEGTYLLRLTVNDGLASEVVDTAIVGIRQLKTDERIPAALETIEADAAKGWKLAVNRILQRVDRLAADSNVIVAVNPSASFAAVGNVVSLDQLTTIKSGLPGEERLPLLTVALATTSANVRGKSLGVVIAAPDGAAPVADGLVYVRMLGLVDIALSGAPAVGDFVYVDDTGVPSLTKGTVTRRIGRVVSSGGGSYRFFIDHTFDRGQRQLVGRQKITATGTYTPTPGTMAVRLRGAGSGGGGGGAEGTGIDSGAAGGGGAGGYIDTWIDPGAPIVGGPVTIGAIGTGGAGTGGTGTSGAACSIEIQGTTYTLGGGAGGTGMSAGTTALAVSGGAGGAAAASGDLTFAGAPGHPAVRVNASTAMSGCGGSSPLGSGGRAVMNGATSVLHASGFGSGGAGAHHSAAGAQIAGGDGTPGAFFVDEYA